MSNKLPNDSTLQTTKQMLDELDALMEKMLSLPMNDLDDALPFPEEVVKAPTMGATLTLLAPSAQERAPPEPRSSYLSPSHPGLNPPHINMPALEPAAPMMYQEPAPQPEPLTNEVAPPSRLAELEPLLAALPGSAAPLTTQWGYLPLVWINSAFDRSTTVLGGAGDGLRSEVGRMLLGVSGAAMMVVAVGWFLKDWLGWNW